MCTFASEDILAGDGCANNGGLKVKAWYALYDDISVFATAPASPTGFADSATTSTGYTMKAAKYFRELHSDLEMSQFVGESAGSVNNLSAANKFTFKQAGTSKQLVGLLNSIKNKNLVVIFEDLAGNKRIVGSEALPAKLESFNESTGAKVADEKSVTFTVYAPGDLPLFLAQTVPVEP
jgi:hypothetical protein